MHRHALGRFGRTAAAVAVAVLALTGCQSVDEDAIEAQALTDETLNDPVEPIGPGSAMTVEGYEWAFDIVDGVAIDGPVEVTFRNTGGTVHTFVIDNAAGETKKIEAAAGEENVGTLKLFAGNYTYYCDVPGHRQQGMEGELTVFVSEEEAPSEYPSDSQSGADA